MYLKRIEIRNIRSVHDLSWEVDAPELAGWHVIIGDNGSGKSTVLRAVALALVGESQAVALRQNWNDWLRRDASAGRVTLYLDYDPKVDQFTGSGKLPSRVYLPASLKLSRDVRFRSRSSSKTPQMRLGSVLLSQTRRLKPDPERHVWGSGGGWFCASYGPFRRFAGGDKDSEKLYYSNPRLAPHLSVFGENVALTEVLSWLQSLHVKKLEFEAQRLKKQEGKAEGQLLDLVVEFVNQKGFLPHDTKLHDVSSRGVVFRDGNGCLVNVEQLSDGYRSVLSMTFEIISQIVRRFGVKRTLEFFGEKSIDVPGVVLIDEIDAHLHPTWQRRIGLWFREHFPLLQFIVTTHSPLVCQAAEHGTVWRLPRPGSDDAAERITGTELNRLLYGSVLARSIHDSTTAASRSRVRFARDESRRGAGGAYSVRPMVAGG